LPENACTRAAGPGAAPPSAPRPWSQVGRRADRLPGRASAHGLADGPRRGAAGRRRTGGAGRIAAGGPPHRGRPPV